MSTIKVESVNHFQMRHNSVTKRKSARGRIIGAALLLFISFLPLHFHTIDESHRISQECSCYLGGQPQLASAPSPPALQLFPPQVFFVAVGRSEALVSLKIESDFARAPPSAHI
jgi:hypothetical protein